jgi:30S ribosomal protein S31
MGKGDRRSRRGKLFAKSYGKTRPRKTAVKKHTGKPAAAKKAPAAKKK